jgi:hypothetical protein
MPISTWKIPDGKGCSVKTPQLGKPARLTLWLSLAVIRCGDGRSRTKVNLDERPRTPANGFEDRRANVRRCPPQSARVQYLLSTFRSCAPPSALVRGLGCHLGCHLRQRRRSVSSAEQTTSCK